mmetsp:Transcript_3224/g.3824  ORF Transcript_3224/g.3824 Transcript_3224/m.3824 type:complete len:468 (-) Transcript_3224:60-1463(-)
MDYNATLATQNASMLLKNGLEHLSYMFYLVPWWQMGKIESLDEIQYLEKSTLTFFGLLFVEIIASLVKGIKLFRLEDLSISIFLGSLTTMIAPALAVVRIGTYVWIYEHFHIMDLTPSSPFTWFLNLLLVDLGYYWLHRHCHQYHVFWWGHSVHHSGEDYNLGTALRQGIMQSVTGWMWFLPIALVSPPEVFLAHKELNTLYQFWIHTTLVGKLGFLELFLNTPSHHRMHHRPPGNCNYAGVLIIWDRMFGTFVQEDEQKDYYGLAKQYTTHDPVWANLEHPRRVLNNIGHSKEKKIWFYLTLPFKKRVKHKWVFNPLVLLEGMGKGETDCWKLPNKSKRIKLASKHTGVMYSYLCIYTLNVLISLLFSMKNKNLSSAELVIVQAYAVGSMVCIGRLFDGKGIVLQTFKVAACLAGAYFLVKQPNVAFFQSVDRKLLLNMFALDSALWSFSLLCSQTKPVNAKLKQN